MGILGTSGFPGGPGMKVCLIHGYCKNHANDCIFKLFEEKGAMASTKSEESSTLFLNIGQGEAGATGPRGTSGLQGSRGEPGRQGSPGSQGNQVQSHLSCYLEKGYILMIYVLNGPHNIDAIFRDHQEQMALLELKDHQ